MGAYAASLGTIETAGFGCILPYSRFTSFEDSKVDCVNWMSLFASGVVAYCMEF